MIIYRNSVLRQDDEDEGGDELCSDSFPCKIVQDETFYKFTLGKRKDVESGDYNTGANESQEVASEGTEESVKEGINAVLNHELVLAEMPSTKYFKAYIKKYYTALKKTVNDKYDTETAEKRLKSVQTMFKNLLEDFDNLEFYSGKHYNSDGTLLIIQWDGVTPYGLLAIDGIMEEKF